MKTFNRVLALSLTVALAMVARAGTWYVDCQVETDGYDGLAESYDPATGHGPKKYIQSAIALAEAEYKVGDHNQVVVLPGSYATGENYLSTKSAANMCASRVVISKPLTLTARDGKEKTEIVGRYGTIAEADKSSPNVAYFENLGKDAVRCIYVATAAAGTVIEGFTLRNGATWYNNNTNETDVIKQAESGIEVVKHYGGGVCVQTGANVYVCDCIIRDCWGFYSGIIHNGTAARCKIESCTVGWKNTAAINNTRLSNCLFIRNGQLPTVKTYLVRAASYIVNCTMVGNQLGVMHTGAQTNFNGLCWGNNREGATDSNTKTHFAQNTVYSKAANATPLAGGGETCLFSQTNDCFFSSGTDDLRLMDDSPAIGFGVYSDLDALTADLPERHRLKDYLGNAIVPDANGKINCGAIQSVVKYEDLKTGTLRIHLSRMDAFGGRPLVHAVFPYNDVLIRSETQSAVTLCTSNNTAVGYFYTALPIAVLADADKTLSVPLPPVGRTLTMVFEQNERPIGKMTVTPEGTDYIASVSDMARPFRGWRLDDGTYAEPWSTSVSLTTLGGRSVEPVYTADWYVNPKGSDANNGMAPSLAKKTLQAAMENAALAMGDTVHAAAGVYDKGEMWGKFVETAYLKESDLTVSNLPSRVIVPIGVTLLADEGPEKTIIVGRAATDASAPMGLGTGAMRCVLLNSGADAQRPVLDGFTLTGGRTLNAKNSKGSYLDSDNAGGGVASDRIGISNAALVRNCIISNCFARTGGGSFGARLINTRVYDVNASEGAAAFFGYFNNCVFDHITTDDRVLRNFRTIVKGCTFGPHLYNASGTPKTSIGTANASGVEFCNNIVRIKNPFDKYYEKIANCALNKESVTNFPDRVSACTFYDAAEFAALVDDEGRPIAGTEDETITKGGDIAEHDWKLCGDSDAVGAPRISNGAVSIGAYQADWRAQYAKVLCGGRAKVDVTSVSTNVTWTYGTDYLRLHDGDSLSLKTKKPPAGPGSLAQDVTGGGQLTVMDGAVAVSPTDDVYTVFAHDNDTLSVSCAGVAGAYADIGSLTLAKLGLLLMVR